MIKLEYFTPNDFQQLISWLDDESSLKQWAGSQFRFPLTKEKLEWYLEDSNDFEHSDTLNYRAVDDQTCETVGHISLTAINRQNRSARMTRMLISPGCRGKGLCRQIVSALVKVGFLELDLHRISLGVYDFNDSAIKCYLKSGFKKDGVLRDISRHGDTYWSLMEMSILENEFREIYLR